MDKDLTYIVTGVTGFVGSVLAKRLMLENVRVVGFARSESKVKTVFGDDPPEIVYGDITDASDVERLFGSNDGAVVIHTAAKVTIGEGDMKLAHAITADGARNVVNACVRHNAKKLLSISSTEVLSCVKDIPAEVNYRPEPQKMRKGYAAAKATADEIVLGAVREHDLNASILIFSSVLGPGDHSRSHMSQMMIDFTEGRLPASIKGGYNCFDVRDVAGVLPSVIDNARKGEVYIFAGHDVAINDILSVVASVADRKMPPTLPMWLAYVGLPFLSLYSKLAKKRPLYTGTALAAIKSNRPFPIDKSVREFGYEPRPIADTVRDHAQFLIDNGYATPKPNKKKK